MARWLMLILLFACVAPADGPAASPPGEIAFSVKHGDGDSPWDIYVVRADGRWVLKKTTRLQESDPVWSPDGRRIAFYGWVAPPDWAGARGWIYTMRPDGTQRRRLARGFSPQWSPDARWIAYDNDAVYVMHADGTGKKRVARGGDPRWSPDGRQIAFTRAGDIYVVPAGGGPERRLTRTGDNGMGAWSPGRKIVFAHSALNGAAPVSGIYVVNPDGTGLRRVAQASDYVTPSIGGWSPDGKRLVYAAGDGISTWQVGDGSVRRLRRAAEDSAPAWAPDGREIAFTRNFGPKGGDGIWLVTSDGRSARRIAAPANPYPHLEPNEYYTPAWAPST